jgi:DNA repair exonuclease SbcCD nuclease subunit
VKETFRRAVNLALEPSRGIGAVVISGNLFDQHTPDSETLSFVRGLLGRLVAARKPVILLPGYRDSLSYADCVYKTERWPGVDVMTSASFEEPVVHNIDGVRVEFYGVAAELSRTPREFLGFPEWDLQKDTPTEVLLEVESGAEQAPAPASQATPVLRIGVLCCGLPDHEEAAVRPHFQTVEPTVLGQSGLDYIALGGYHGFTCLRLGSTTAVWPGTPIGRRFETGDLGQKSFVIAEIEPGQVHLRREPTEAAVLEDATVDLLAERITSPDDLTAAILARSGDQVIARLRVRGPLEFLCDFPEVASKVEARFRHLELVDETDLLDSGLLRRIEGEHTIRGFFVRRMLARIEALTQRAAASPGTSQIERDLAISKRALKVGLEQFMEEEAASDVLTPRQETQRTETHVKPPSVRRDGQTPNNGHDVLELPEARSRGLLRSERSSLKEGEASQ